MSDKRDTIKKVVNFIVGSSVGYTVSSALINNATADNAVRKTEAVIGGVVVGAVVAEQTESWTSKQVDDIFDAIDSYRAGR